MERNPWLRRTASLVVGSTVMVLCAIAASLALPAPTVDDVTGRLLGAMLDATGPVALAAGVIGWLFWVLLVRMNPFGTGPV